MQNGGQVPFGDLLAAHLEARGMSQHSFARAVGQKHPAVNRIIRGRNAPPLKHLDRWISALHLHGKEEAAFRLAAWLANAPPELRAHVAELTARLGSSAKRVPSPSRPR